MLKDNILDKVKKTVFLHTIMVVKDNSRKKIAVSQFQSGEEEEVSELVQSSLDQVVNNYYNPNILGFLKSMYTPERVLEFATVRDNNYVYLARVKGDLKWVASYEHKVDDLEMGMFYGQHSFYGIRSAIELLKTGERLASYLGAKKIIGKVLIPAAMFVERCSKEGVIMTYPEKIVEDIDRNSGEKVYLKIKPFVYYIKR